MHTNFLWLTAHTCNQNVKIIIIIVIHSPTFSIINKHLLCPPLLMASVSVPHHGHDQFHDSFFTINHFLMSIISKVNMHHLYKSDIILITFLRK